jgi:hypothetical protein
VSFAIGFATAQTTIAFCSGLGVIAFGIGPRAIAFGTALCAIAEVLVTPLLTVDGLSWLRLISIASIKRVSFVFLGI